MAKKPPTKVVRYKHNEPSKPPPMRLWRVTTAQGDYVDVVAHDMTAYEGMVIFQMQIGDDRTNVEVWAPGTWKLCQLRVPDGET